MPISDKEDRDRRIAALAKLALGTGKYPPIQSREDKVAMQAFLLMYLEDTAQFPCDVFVEACERRRLASPFFPTSSEFLAECGTVLARRREQAEAQRRARLMPPEPSPERRADFLRRLRELIAAKSMK